MSLGAVTKSLCQMMISCRKDPSIDYPFEIEAYIEVGVYSKPTSHRMPIGYCSTHLDGQAADTPLSNSPLVSSCARILRVTLPVAQFAWLGSSWLRTGLSKIGHTEPSLICLLQKSCQLETLVVNITELSYSKNRDFANSDFLYHSDFGESSHVELRLVPTPLDLSRIVSRRGREISPCLFCVPSEI